MAKCPLVMEEHAARLEVEARVWHKALECYDHLLSRFVENAGNAYTFDH